MSSNPNQPLQPPRKISIAEALASGDIGALMIVRSAHEASWSIPDWLAQDMTHAFADELVDKFRDVLYDCIRPKG